MPNFDYTLVKELKSIDHALIPYSDEYLFYSLVNDPQFYQKAVTTTFQKYYGEDPDLKDPEKLKSAFDQYKSSYDKLIGKSLYSGQDYTATIKARQEAFLQQDDFKEFDPDEYVGTIKKNKKQYEKFGLFDEAGNFLYEDQKAFRLKVKQDPALFKQIVNTDFDQFNLELTKSNNDLKAVKQTPNKLLEAWTVYKTFGSEGLTDYVNSLSGDETQKEAARVKLKQRRQLGMSNDYGSKFLDPNTLLGEIKFEPILPNKASKVQLPPDWSTYTEQLGVYELKGGVYQKKNPEAVVSEKLKDPNFQLAVGVSYLGSAGRKYETKDESKWQKVQPVTDASVIVDERLKDPEFRKMVEGSQTAASSANGEFVNPYIGAAYAVASTMAGIFPYGKEWLAELKIQDIVDPEDVKRVNEARLEVAKQDLIDNNNNSTFYRRFTHDVMNNNVLFKTSEELVNSIATNGKYGKTEDGRDYWDFKYDDLPWESKVAYDALRNNRFSGMFTRQDDGTLRLYPDGQQKLQKEYEDRFYMKGLFPTTTTGVYNSETGRYEFTEKYQQGWVATPANALMGIFSGAEAGVEKFVWNKVANFYGDDTNIPEFMRRTIHGSEFARFGENDWKLKTAGVFGDMAGYLTVLAADAYLLKKAGSGIGSMVSKYMPATAEALIMSETAVVGKLAAPKSKMFLSAQKMFAGIPKVAKAMGSEVSLGTRMATADIVEETLFTPKDQTFAYNANMLATMVGQQFGAEDFNSKDIYDLEKKYESASNGTRMVIDAISAIAMNNFAGAILTGVKFGKDAIKLKGFKQAVKTVDIDPITGEFRTDNTLSFRPQTRIIWNNLLNGLQGKAVTEVGTAFATRIKSSVGKVTEDFLESAKQAGFDDVKGQIRQTIEHLDEQLGGRIRLTPEQINKLVDENYARFIGQSADGIKSVIKNADNPEQLAEAFRIGLIGTRSQLDLVAENVPIEKVNELRVDNPNIIVRNNADGTHNVFTIPEDSWKFDLANEISKRVNQSSKEERLQIHFEKDGLVEVNGVFPDGVVPKRRALKERMDSLYKKPVIKDDKKGYIVDFDDTDKTVTVLYEDGTIVKESQDILPKEVVVPPAAKVVAEAVQTDDNAYNSAVYSYGLYGDKKGLESLGMKPGDVDDDMFRLAAEELNPNMPKGLPIDELKTQLKTKDLDEQIKSSVALDGKTNAKLGDIKRILKNEFGYTDEELKTLRTKDSGVAKLYDELKKENDAETKPVEEVKAETTKEQQKSDIEKTKYGTISGSIPLSEALPNGVYIDLGDGLFAHADKNEKIAAIVDRDNNYVVSKSFWNDKTGWQLPNKANLKDDAKKLGVDEATYIKKYQDAVDSLNAKYDKELKALEQTDTPVKNLDNKFTEIFNSSESNKTGLANNFGKTLDDSELSQLKQMIQDTESRLASEKELLDPMEVVDAGVKLNLMRDALEGALEVRNKIQPSELKSVDQAEALKAVDEVDAGVAKTNESITSEVKTQDNKAVGKLVEETAKKNHDLVPKKMVLRELPEHVQAIWKQLGLSKPGVVSGNVFRNLGLLSDQMLNLVVNKKRVVGKNLTPVKFIENKPIPKDVVVAVARQDGTVEYFVSNGDFPANHPVPPTRFIQNEDGTLVVNADWTRVGQNATIRNGKLPEFVLVDTNTFRQAREGESGYYLNIQNPTERALNNSESLAFGIDAQHFTINGEHHYRVVDFDGQVVDPKSINNTNKTKVVADGRPGAETSGVLNASIRPLITGGAGYMAGQVYGVATNMSDEKREKLAGVLGFAGLTGGLAYGSFKSVRTGLNSPVTAYKAYKQRVMNANMTSGDYIREFQMLKEHIEMGRSVTGRQMTILQAIKKSGLINEAEIDAVMKIVKDDGIPDTKRPFDTDVPAEKPNDLLTRFQIKYTTSGESFFRSFGLKSVLEFGEMMRVAGATGVGKVKRPFVSYLGKLAPGGWDGINAHVEKIARDVVGSVSDRKLDTAGARAEFNNALSRFIENKMTYQNGKVVIGEDNYISQYYKNTPGMDKIDEAFAKNPEFMSYVKGVSDSFDHNAKTIFIPAFEKIKVQKLMGMINPRVAAVAKEFSDSGKSWDEFVETADPITKRDLFFVDKLKSTDPDIVSLKEIRAIQGRINDMNKHSGKYYPGMVSYRKYEIFRQKMQAEYDLKSAEYKQTKSLDDFAEEEFSWRIIEFNRKNQGKEGVNALLEYSSDGETVRPKGFGKYEKAKARIEEILANLEPGKRAEISQRFVAEDFLQEVEKVAKNGRKYKVWNIVQPDSDLKYSIVDDANKGKLVEIFRKSINRDKIQKSNHLERPRNYYIPEEFREDSMTSVIDRYTHDTGGRAIMLENGLFNDADIERKFTGFQQEMIKKNIPIEEAADQIDNLKQWSEELLNYSKAQDINKDPYVARRDMVARAAMSVTSSLFRSVGFTSICGALNWYSIWGFNQIAQLYGYKNTLKSMYKLNSGAELARIQRMGTMFNSISKHVASMNPDYGLMYNMNVPRRTNLEKFTGIASAVAESGTEVFSSISLARGANYMWNKIKPEQLKFDMNSLGGWRILFENLKNATMIETGLVNMTAVYEVFKTVDAITELEKSGKPLTTVNGVTKNKTHLLEDLARLGVSESMASRIGKNMDRYIATFEKFDPEKNSIDEIDQVWMDDVSHIMNRATDMYHSRDKALRPMFGNSALGKMVYQFKNFSFNMAHQTLVKQTQEPINAWVDRHPELADQPLYSVLGKALAGKLPKEVIDDVPYGAFVNLFWLGTVYMGIGTAATLSVLYYKDLCNYAVAETYSTVTGEDNPLDRDIFEKANKDFKRRLGDKFNAVIDDGTAKDYLNLSVAYLGLMNDVGALGAYSNVLPVAGLNYNATNPIRNVPAFSMAEGAFGTVGGAVGSVITLPIDMAFGTDINDNKANSNAGKALIRIMPANGLYGEFLQALLKKQREDSKKMSNGGVFIPL